jgi:nucleoside-diphosphate-sugar epimerase
MKARNGNVLLNGSSMDRILVTGGTTFSGLHLVRSLVRDGHAVRVLTRSAERAHAMLPAETEILVGDVTERADVARAMEGREVVYHLADSAGTGRVTSTDDHWRMNVLATRLVMQAALDAGARRIVHSGTARVHGDTGRRSANEESDFRPTNAYELTKMQGERLALLFARERGLPVAFARPTWTYGADDRRFRRMMAAVRRGHIVIPGTRRARVHPIHVDDLVRGLKLLATRDDAVGECFILGGPEHLALDELITVLARAIGVRRPQVHIPELSTRFLVWASQRLSFTGGLRGRLEFFTKSHVFDVGKAARVLGFNPRVSVAEGVGRTVLWEERIAVVGRGRNQTRRATMEIPRPSAELRRRYALSDDALVVGAVSRFFPLSGTRHLIEAFPRIHAAVPAARLLVVGDGAEREALETQARRLGISPFVIFAGMHEDIAAHLRLCDVAVVASTDDGLSLAAMEALSAGVPLVATRMGGLSSIVRDGENGLLVPPGDAGALASAVIRVLRNPVLRGELAARMGAAARSGSLDRWADGSPRAALG